MPVALSDEEWAYAAGVIDGEGCIKGRKSSRSITIDLHVTNTNAELLLWLQQRLGGSIHRHHDGCGRWWAAASTQRDILEGVLPYLVTKRDQAEAALRLLDIRRDRTGHLYSDSEHAERESLFQKLRQLKEASKNFGAYYAETRAAVAL